MTPDQTKSVMNDIAQVHYPMTTPEQSRALVARLHHYPYEIVLDAVQDFARMHDHLNVEKLIAAVGELAKTRNLDEHRQRREADDAERAEIAAEAERIDTAIASLSLEEFAELLEEVRLEEGDRFTPRMYARGRGDKAMRGLVYQRMKRAAYQRARQPQPIGGR
jgi:hypothetical protein